MIGFEIIISFIAGGLIAFSAVPALIGKIKRQITGIKSDYGVGDACRDAAITIGNGLWVVFGIHQGIPAIVLFCGTTTILTLCLIVVGVRCNSEPSSRP